MADPIGVSPKEMKNLRKAFNKFDTDGSGTIEAAELSNVSRPSHLFFDCCAL